jgi:hypothetical protein
MVKTGPFVDLFEQPLLKVEVLKDPGASNVVS